MIFVPLKYLHKRLSYFKVLAKDQTLNLFALRKGPSLSTQYNYLFAYYCRLLITLCKHFGPRSGPTTCPPWSGSKLFDTLMVFLKEFFENVDFEKKNSR